MSRLIDNMNINKKLLLIALVGIAFGVWPVFAMDFGLVGVSQQCLRDCGSADSVVSQLKSTEPLLELSKRYTNEADQAYLEVYIGMVYGQRTGVVDPAKSLVHLTAALRYELPEKTYIQVLMWRGGSQEQLNKTKEALKDYLRGLLACSYHDLSGGWPKIQSSKVPIFMNSHDSENGERARDYNTYRKSLDLQQFLLMQRYYFIDAVKRVTRESSNSETEIMEILGDLSPDSARTRVVREWLKSENKRPWP
jgi:hypothetical protein